MRLGSRKAFPNRSLRTELGLAAGSATILCDIPAFAHGTGPHDASNLWHGWHVDPLISLPLLASCLLFVRGVRHLRRDLGRFPPGFGSRQIACFTLGAALLVIALLSPLEALYSVLLSAHMVQHILLIAVAPPLLVLGKPEIVWLWALPAHWRRGVARRGPLRLLLSILSPWARPIPAALIHMAALLF